MGFFQTRRRVEHEAQEETSDASPQGCEPIHKRAMRFQSQASFEDSQDISNEEVEGDDQLEGLRVREGASQHALVDLESLIFGRGGRTHQAVSRALYYSVARQRLLCLHQLK